jgi:hypothetical protein
MPAGLALGVGASDAGLFVTLRYGPGLFDDEAAERFSSRFLDVLLGA